VDAPSSVAPHLVNDTASKRLFSVQMFVFTLVETGGQDNARVLAMPAQ
jgi:hypothetical protein